ncbi:DUF3329 domain-containing protein [Azotosporobacter soli]|uniref:DUF3329 domain-containing protein n=1 Tax=Azotosporobacter soli TaxID=3055040 RepID=UPI0031FF2286
MSIDKGSEEVQPLTKENWFAWGMLGAVFAYMLTLNIWMPLHRDDYEYALIWGTLDKIASWSDVYQSLQLHYLTHGGRMVAFAVLDSFLLLGKQWFNPLNAFLFVALIVLVYWHSQRTLTNRFNPYILGLITLFCWLCFPQFGSVNIWMTGACVYLLTAVLIFSFLLPYHLAFWKRSPLQDTWLNAVLFFPAGIIAGWTVENTAVTMIFAVLCLIWDAYRKKYLEKWMCSGFAGAVLGGALLTGAPGNYVRYAEQSAKPIVHVTNILAASGEMLLYMLPLVLFGVLLWRAVRVEYAVTHQGLQMPKPMLAGRGVAAALNWSVIALIVISYCNGKFLSLWLGQLLFNKVAVPLGIATGHLQVQLSNTLAGLEEMALYLLVITQIYKQLAKKMTLRKCDVKGLEPKVGWRKLAAVYPEVGAAALALSLALLNNFVMIGSPRFPGRATFGTVVFCIIGVMALLSVAQVKERFLGAASKKYAAAALIGLLLLPLATVTLQQYAIVDRVDQERIVYIRQMVQQGKTDLELSPVPITNRALLHVYYIEWNNPVSKYGLCRYYGLKDVKVIDQNGSLAK